MYVEKPDVAREDVAFVFQMLESDSQILKFEEGLEDYIENSFVSNQKYREAFKNTILLAIRDDCIVTVLMAGVMPLLNIDLSKTLEKYGLSPVMVYDACYSRTAGGITIAATTCGPKPQFKKEKNFGIPTDEPGDYAVHTHLFCYKFEILDQYWDLALRFLRLCYGFGLLKCSYDSFVKEWEPHMQILTNRFETGSANVRIGELLIDMLLSGTTEPAGEAFLERGMGVDGLNGIRDYLDKHLIEVIRIIRGQVQALVRNMTFQSDEFEAVSRSIMEELYLNVNRNEVLNLPFQQDIDSEFVTMIRRNPISDNLRNVSKRLEYKSKQMLHSAEIMMQEIDHLFKWLSVLKPFARAFKANLLVKTKRLDINKLMRFVVETFVTKRHKANYNLLMFEVDRLCQILRQQEKNTRFNEEEFFKMAKEHAEQQHKEYLSQLKALRPDVIEYTGKRPSFAPSPDNDDDEPDDERIKVDLDRLGSFFKHNFSETAKKVLKDCNTFLSTIEPTMVVDGKIKLTEEAKLTTFERVFNELAHTILNNANVVDEPLLNHLNLLWMFEIESSAQHQGFQYVRLNNSRPDYRKFESDSDEIFKRSVHVTAASKTTFHSHVISSNAADKMRKEFFEGPIGLLSAVFKIDESAEAPQIESNDGSERQTDEPMEIDVSPLGQLQIEIDEPLRRSRYNRLVAFDAVFPGNDGELYAIGKFTAAEESSGVIPRMMKLALSVTPNEESVWIVQDDDYDTSEVPEKVQVCESLTRGTYVHDEGTRVAIFSIDHKTFARKSIGNKISRKQFSTRKMTLFIPVYSL
ncbi:unnamed protein product [Caenorhabditis bovis]|uniref:Uncharacterized protein n=1 Tax=Caenorhabditis bovis TaxID=2654633 RepID=A0A8S1ESD4_9PELO|nr:unnamed protein product [Caenorhabditis bovis]